MKEEKARLDLIKKQLLGEIYHKDSISHKSSQAKYKKISRKIKKRSKLSLSELWEILNRNNNFVLILIIISLITISCFGAYVFEVGFNKRFKSFWDTIWWSVVTFTTVGYGDKYPITTGGRIVGILMMLLGVVTVGIVTGRIASFLVNEQIKARGGLIVLDRKKGHFIVCGWKRELETILDNILDVNPRLKPSSIVLINDADPEEIDHIRSISRFKMIKYIKGDYIDEKVLKRANVKNASTALVLADSSRKFSVNEVDSRTVMTVITIDSMNKNIYTCAELIDEKFEKYLKFAHCDEIILTRRYSRGLIANAASASGVSHIAVNLLNPEAGGLDTESFPDDYIGRPFRELQDYIKDMYGDIAIGLLENTGKIYYRKKEALAEAQKTPDISKLVENLQEVKGMISNKPVLNPGDDYIIKKNSKAVVVKRQSSNHQLEGEG